MAAALLPGALSALKALGCGSKFHPVSPPVVDNGIQLGTYSFGRSSFYRRDSPALNWDGLQIYEKRRLRLARSSFYRRDSPTLNWGGLQMCEKRRLRLASCHVRREGEGVHANSRTRYKAEAAAAAESSSTRGREISGSNSRDLWGNSISLGTQRDCGGERSTQSIGVEPTVNPPFGLTSIQQDTGMACAVLLGGFVWVRFFDYFTSKQILSQKLSRKMVHITSGLLYVMSWPFFSSSNLAPFMAGLAPLANGFRLLIYGLGILEDEGLVKSMSRSGESRELLRGPLYYVLVLYLSTVLFWRRSPVGIVALGMMCGGDGIADIMGRKFGSKKLPYNRDKSFAGSISMFLFGFMVSFAFVYYFTAFGFFSLDLYRAAKLLALISLAATIVESLPITTQLDDNFTVPLTAFVLGIVLFPSS